MGRKHATSHQRFKPRFDRRRLQRGAVAIWVGVSIVAFIAATFLSIDVGRLYFTQRNLQKTATLAAISAAQIASGCTNGDGIRVDPDQMFSQVQALIVANGGQAGWLSGFNGFDAIEVGQTRTNSAGLRAFQALPAGDERINSVRVNLQRPAPTSFVPSILTNGGATLKASSTAEQRVLGSFYIGSGLADLDAGLLNALLGALLGSNINLSLADFRSLAATQVTLGALATALNVRVTDLSNLTELGLDTPLLPNLLGGLVGGLGNTASATVSGLLQQLAGAARNETVPLGVLLGPLTDVAGNVPFINLLDLIMALGTAATADGDPYANPIVVPLDVDVSGVAKVSVFLKVLEPPQFGVGTPGATAKTAQVKLAVRIEAGQLLQSLSAFVNQALAGLLNILTGALRLLTLGLVDIRPTGPTLIPNLNLGVDVNVAQAAARLDEIACPTATRPYPVARLSVSPAVATVHIGSFIGTPSTNPSTIPQLDLNGTHFDVLHLGLTAQGLLGALGGLNVDVGLDLTCVSVGGACNGPSAPSTGPFFPLPNDVDSFEYVPIGDNPISRTRSAYYQADGVPPAAEVAGVNPQTVGTDPAVAVRLGLRTPVVTSNGGLLGGLGALLNDLVEGLLGLVNPLLNLVNGLLASLVTPLLNLLGIQLGQATVIMDAVSVDRPARVSNCLPGATTGGRVCPLPD